GPSVSAPPTKRPAKAAPPTADPTQQLLSQLASHFAALLAPMLAAPAERYYDARTVPGEVGRRQFLAAAAEGAFPAFRVGNRLVARREDVHRWIEGRPVEPRPAPRARKGPKARSAETAADDAKVLARAGLVPRDRPKGDS
ncbi:MAG: hypothetical protein JWM10_4942, partial [Myxococcaceae bacterium]|nr:hypothetical protein [Myxococcaceae bacterium]